MQNLVDRVRALANADHDEYAIGQTTYWADSHIQDVLASNAQFVVDSPLTYQSQNISGTTNYIIAQAQYNSWEEAESGTARWIVRDSTGVEYGTANYTVDYRAGRVSFTSDRGGTLYYVTGYTYDVNAAAADLWMMRLANFNDWYDFKADNQTFNRDQVFNHAEKMEQRLRAKAGENVTGVGGDVRSSEFVRVDINV